MQTALNVVFKLLAGLGVLMALFGIGIEFLPGAHPGLNLPQGMLIVGSLLLSLAAFSSAAGGWAAAGLGSDAEALAAGIGRCRGDADCA